jgi:hypothetical protein
MHSIILLTLFICLGRSIVGQKINQEIHNSNGPFIQSVGDNNINIGAIYKTEIKKVKIVKPDYATIKISVNTISKVFKDGKELGIATIKRPLKISLQRGMHRINVISKKFDNLSLKYEFIVEKESIGAETYLDFKFTIGKYLCPILLSNDFSLGRRLGYFNIMTHELTIDAKFSDAHNFAEGRAAVSIEHKWGFIDEFGKAITEFKYDRVFDFKNGKAVVELKDSSALIDRDGKLIMPWINASILGNFKGDFAIAGRWLGPYGIINSSGKFVITPQYSFIENNPDELLLKVAIGGQSLVSVGDGKSTQINAKWGLVTRSGKQLLPAIYDEILYKHQPNYVDIGKIIGIKQSGKWKFIRLENGETYKSVNYDDIVELEDDLMIVSKGEKFGLIDWQFREIIPVKYDYVGKLGNDVLRVDSSEKVAAFNKDGTQITPFRYDDIEDFSAGLARVELNDKSAFINTSGQEVTTFQYDDPQSSHYKQDYYGYRVVSRNSKVGLINKGGKEVTEILYDDILYGVLRNADDGIGTSLYLDSIGVVFMNEKYGYIDKYGILITSKVYDWVDGFYDNREVAIIKLNKRYGLINRKGQEIVKPTKYTWGQNYFGGLVRMSVNDKFVYLDSKGKCVFGCN